jgi:hypothetical protein
VPLKEEERSRVLESMVLRKIPGPERNSKRLKKII